MLELLAVEVAAVGKGVLVEFPSIPGPPKGIVENVVSEEDMEGEEDDGMKQRR